MADDRLQALTRLMEGRFFDLLGIKATELGDGRAVVEMQFRPDLRQLTGLFHGGAIITLADTAATFAALTIVNPDGDSDLSRFPPSFQISANLVRNVNQGKIIAEAEVTHHGRTTIVVEAKVRDENDRLLALTSVTLLAPGR